ncbi:MAG: CDP-alcohol phosphatidyltransferase family protein [Oscillospiraceae bacterium]|nr:CDP-alcohol phosphatidyltransferase family protein [Oscillospiraceae bacterium]
MNRPRLKDFFTVPNILSYFRILLIPLFCHLYLNAGEPRDYYLAAFVIGVSGLTDFLDGIIARRFNQRTEIGEILDPLADKLTQAAVVLCLASRYPLMWLLFALLIMRESYLLIEGVIMLKKGKSLHGARWYGKVSTFIFYLVILALLLFPELHPTAVTALILFCALWLLIALVMYVSAYSAMKKEDASCPSTNSTAKPAKNASQEK